MIDSGDIGSVARWLVRTLASRGYQRDDLVALATELLDQVRASLEQQPGASHGTTAT